MKFVTPLIFIAVAIAAFFLLTVPIYGDLRSLRTEIASYNEALGNSKALENERDKLAAKYNSFRTEDLSRLEKLLPESADNIRLILEIEQLASPYSMTLKDVKYNTTDTGVSNATVQRSGARQLSKNYGTMELEFNTSGTYDDFINFTKSLENNLRIVDIVAITFSSDKGPSLGKIAPSTSYDYNFKVKTYWLKN
jgi:Tfp pilus assembly protein PilO